MRRYHRDGRTAVVLTGENYYGSFAVRVHPRPTSLVLRSYFKGHTIASRPPELRVATDALHSVNAAGSHHCVRTRRAAPEEAPLKRQLATLAALTAGISGVAAIALPLGSASGSTGHDQLTRCTRFLSRCATPTPRTGSWGKARTSPVIGDAFIDSGPVRQQQKIVGHATNICTIVAGTSEATFITQCAATYTLRGGEFTTAGADDSSNRTTDAVTGGTRAYAYATGSATTVSGSQAATVTITYVIAR